MPYTGPAPFVEPQVLNVNGNPIYYVNPLIPITKRIVLFNGTGGSPETYLTPPFDTMSHALLDHGYQIVMIHIKTTSDEACLRASMADGGIAYAADWKKRVGEMLDAMDLNFGTVSTTVIGGFSLGGLHSLMAVELLPGRFTAWFGYKPVTKLSALSEFSDMDVPYFNPLVDDSALAQTPGYLAWSDDDTRTDANLTIGLYNDLQAKSAPIEGTDYPGEEHNLSSAAIGDITTWLLTL